MGNLGDESASPLFRKSPIRIEASTIPAVTIAAKPLSGINVHDRNRGHLCARRREWFSGMWDKYGENI